MEGPSDQQLIENLFDTDFFNLLESTEPNISNDPPMWMCEPKDLIFGLLSLQLDTPKLSTQTFTYFDVCECCPWELGDDRWPTHGEHSFGARKMEVSGHTSVRKCCSCCCCGRQPAHAPYIMPWLQQTIIRPWLSGYSSAPPPLDRTSHCVPNDIGSTLIFVSGSEHRRLTPCFIH